MPHSLFIRSLLLQKHGFNAIFSQRQGGVSPAPFDSLNFGVDMDDSDANREENLSRLSQATGMLAFPHRAKQVHQASSLWCEGSGVLHPDEADILLTQSAGKAVAVQTADCLPILLADRKTSIVAAVHAGWRGTVAGVVKRAINEMREKGADIQSIVASLGPCIAPCCFEVSDDVADRLASSCLKGEKYVSKDVSKRVDLSGVNRQQLLDMGVKSGNIEWLRHCTYCHPQQFYSYRREQGNTGRHLAIVAVPLAD